MAHTVARAHNVAKVHKRGGGHGGGSDDHCGVSDGQSGANLRVVGLGEWTGRGSKLQILFLLLLCLIASSIGQVHFIRDDPVDLLAVESTLDESRIHSRLGVAVPLDAENEGRSGRRLRPLPGLRLRKRPLFHPIRPMSGPRDALSRRKYKVHNDNIMAENSPGPVTQRVPAPDNMKLSHNTQSAPEKSFLDLVSSKKSAKPKHDPFKPHHPPTRPRVSSKRPRRPSFPMPQSKLRPPPFKGSLETAPSVVRPENLFNDIKKVSPHPAQVSQSPSNRRIFSGGMNILNQMAHRLTSGMRPRPPGGKRPTRPSTTNKGKFGPRKPSRKHKKPSGGRDVPMAPVLTKTDMYGPPKAHIPSGNYNPPADSYGSPQAPSQGDSYGSPQAPTQGADSYGAPQSPIQSDNNYGAPQGSVLNSNSPPASEGFGQLSGYDPVMVFGSKGFVPTGTRNNFDESIQDEIGSSKNPDPFRSTFEKSSGRPTKSVFAPSSDSSSLPSSSLYTQHDGSPVASANAFVTDIETAKREITKAVTPNEELIKPSRTQMQFHPGASDLEAAAENSFDDEGPNFSFPDFELMEISDIEKFFNENFFKKIHADSKAPDSQNLASTHDQDFFHGVPESAYEPTQEEVKNPHMIGNQATGIMDPFEKAVVMKPVQGPKLPKRSQVGKPPIFTPRVNRPVKMRLPPKHQSQAILLPLKIADPLSQQKTQTLVKGLSDLPENNFKYEPSQNEPGSVPQFYSGGSDLGLSKDHEAEFQSHKSEKTALTRLPICSQDQDSTTTFASTFQKDSSPFSKPSTTPATELSSSQQN
eukprot:maker-scaffold531_size145796-snap-gene-0.19 protein:Tk12604 transcript:maker-scaffold531_size145796-snap-gene-0.19-mRNA-1 annotation:"membrane protein"